MATQTNTLPVKAEDTPKVPAKVQGASKAPAKQDKATSTSTAKVGVWDKLAFLAVVALLKDHPRGVSVAQVVEHINTTTPKGDFPQGHTSSRARVLENSLWRMCASKEGDKQAGGGYYTPALLVRNRGSRPVTFTLAQQGPKGKQFPK